MARLWTLGEPKGIVPTTGIEVWDFDEILSADREYAIDRLSWRTGEDSAPLTAGDWAMLISSWLGGASTMEAVMLRVAMQGLSYHSQYWGR